jgi:diadenosine tetraphosphate (Ap4A) HIT family hydrolase
MAYSELPRAAFVEQADAVRAIERTLSNFCRYERINYLMLMMVDRNVHFHVIPRYSAQLRWNDAEFPDAGWPGPPELGSAVKLTQEQIVELSKELASNFL